MNPESGFIVFAIKNIRLPKNIVLGGKRIKGRMGKSISVISNSYTMGCMWR